MVTLLNSYLGPLNIPGARSVGLECQEKGIEDLLDLNNLGICCHNHNTVLLMVQRVMLLMSTIAIHCHFHVYSLNSYVYSMSP